MDTAVTPEEERTEQETETLVLEDTEEQAVSQKKAIRLQDIRAEWVLGVIALLCGALLLVMVVLCIPHFEEEQDPQFLIHQNHVNDAPVTLPTRPPEDPEDPTGETEPETEPTIPP